MMNDELNATDASHMDALLDSCASITAKAFLYRPLTRLRNDEDEIPSFGAAERRISSVRPIPSHSQHHQQQQQQQQQKHPIVLQQELLDESVRLHQEQLLLSRMYMAHAAAATTMRQAHDPHRAVLRKHAVAARSHQVDTALHRHQQLEALQQNIRHVQLQCLQQQDANRKLYSELLLKKQQLNSSMKDSNAGTATTGDDYDDVDNFSDNSKSDHERLRSENTILKGVLSDLIAGGGLDWYSDDRLRRILQS
jgi:Centromere protein H (CENP-H)